MLILTVRFVMLRRSFDRVPVNSRAVRSRIELFSRIVPAASALQRIDSRDGDRS